ncbi:argK protein [Ramicandelaber brevisporus]|nr:argK protein [Ramicandelaber brevisporus]
MPPPTVQQLAAGILAGNRTQLARAITLIESTRPEHRLQAQELLATLQHTRSSEGAAAAVTASSSEPVNSPRAASQAMLQQDLTLNAQKQQRQIQLRRPPMRIGLSGSPGVGKSTFIESFGLNIVGLGHKVSVLAVDPSSSRTGGSILGDKTRMPELSLHDNAYIRPSPSCGSLGGVARRTSEALMLCEAAGYDVGLIETVGVGQSETAVADMVDMFVLLVPPAGGDELQGIKKGIMELADLVVVTKADGHLSTAAREARIEYTSALKYMQPRFSAWRPKVVGVSAKTGEGLDKVWGHIGEFYKAMMDSGELTQLRNRQLQTWMWREVREGLVDRLKRDPVASEELKMMEKRVLERVETPWRAADHVLAAFMNNHLNQHQQQSSI